MSEYEEEIKVIFPHESGAGVTVMLDVIIARPFNPYSQSTLTASFAIYFVEINNKKYCLHLWDSVGQEKYRALNKLFFRESNIVIFVYDVTNMSTFKELVFWIRMIREFLGENCICGIMGTKCDLYLNQEVSDEEAESFAKSHRMKLRLVSSKKDPNSIKKFIEELCYDYLFFKNNKLISVPSDYTFSYLLMGDSCVGKTAIKKVLIQDKAHDGISFLTMGSDVGNKLIDINSKKILTRIRDSSGNENNSFYRNFIKETQAFILIYDITNKQTFLNLEILLKIIEDNKDDNQIIYKILIGNKCDYEDKREIQFEEGKTFADRNGMKFYETSTILYKNIKEFFLEMTKDLIITYEQQKITDEKKIKTSRTNSSGFFSFFNKKTKNEDKNKEKEKELKNVENDLQKEKKKIETLEKRIKELEKEKESKLKNMEKEYKKKVETLEKRIKELEKEKELKLKNMENDLQKDKKRLKSWKKE